MTLKNTKQALVERYARRLVEQNYDGSKPQRRPWFRCEVWPHSYGDTKYRVEIWVREGSPPKGFVVSTANFVLAIDLSGYVIKNLCPYDSDVWDEAEKELLDEQR